MVLRMTQGISSINKNNLCGIIMITLSMFPAPALSYKPQRPNILFILADDLGYNDVGYNNPRMPTPNIDQMARDGVILEKYYVQPICSPTRSVFMSGRLQIHTGLQHGNIGPTQPNGLPLNSKTIATKLSEVGYKTHAIGKWHIGMYKHEYLPTNRGFDTFYGIYFGSSDHYTHRKCLNKYCATDLHDDTKYYRKNVQNETGSYSTTLYTRKAIDIIQSHDPRSPFFMYLAYQAPHGPLQGPGESYGGPPKRLSNKGKREKFKSMVKAMDEGIGDIMATLQRRGLLHNTIVIFSTDNGGALKRGASNLPLRKGKGSYFEGGVRGVGVVYSPLLKQRGYRNRQLIHVSDWFPTFINLAGADFQGTRNVIGYDQWKSISDNRKTKRTYVLHNINTFRYRRPFRTKFNRRTPFDTRYLAAYTKGDYKIITGSKKSRTQEKVVLYNIKNDPREKSDLSKKRPGKVTELLVDLAAFQRTAAPVNFPRLNKNMKPIYGFWQPWL